MTWLEVFQIVSAAILSVSGAGAIFWKFSSYLGKLWASRYLEKIKSEYQKELESYRAELDLIKSNILRYSDKQFKLYSKLWESLCELKFSAVRLWQEANEKNLRDFSEKLQLALENVEKSYLFIEEKSYQTLRDLLKEFGEYRIGKKKVIELRSKYNRSVVSRSEVRRLVENNSHTKQKFLQIMEELGKDLKRQLKGNIYLGN